MHEILKCFCADLPSSTTAQILGLNRKTTDRYYGMFREAIFEHLMRQEQEQMQWECEVDESYFWAKRIRWKRGRGAAWKTPVFGILKRNGKVYVTVVKNCSREQLMPIIQWKVLEWSTIYSDGWKAYDWLILNGYDHFRIFHSNNEFARWKNHVNGIESFWSYAKRRMAKFNGVPKNKFILHLKESEWRFNHRSDNIYKVLMRELSQNPL